MWNKLLSGRFILTVISGIVFAYASWKNKINAEAIAAILSMVFVSYFNKKEDK